MKYNDIKNKNELIYLNSGLFLHDSGSKKYINDRFHDFEKGNKLIRLKRDFYISSENLNNYHEFPEYLEIIACMLKRPSYLSREYVLRKFDVISEATSGFTLVTTKTRTVFTNKAGTFYYNQINPKLFIGYEVKSFINIEYYEATKAKALFDFLYFRKNILPISSDLDLVEDLRLNLEMFSKKDFKELNDYSKLTNSSKMKSIISNIIKNAPNHT